VPERSNVSSVPSSVRSSLALMPSIVTLGRPWSDWLVCDAPDDFVSITAIVAGPWPCVVTFGRAPE
jgi:hypothetical protein